MQLSTLEIFSSGNANRLEATTTLRESEHKMRKLKMRNYYVLERKYKNSKLRRRQCVNLVIS